MAPAHPQQPSVVPATEVLLSQSARDLAVQALGRLDSPLAVLGGALACLQDGVDAEASESVLGLVQTARAQLLDTRRFLDAGVVALPPAGDGAPLVSFGHNTCEQVSTVRAMVHAARMLMVHDEADQAHPSVFAACEVLEQAERLAGEISGGALDVARREGGRA